VLNDLIAKITKGSII